MADSPESRQSAHRYISHKCGDRPPLLSARLRLHSEPQSHCPLERTKQATNYCREWRDVSQNDRHNGNDATYTDLTVWRWHRWVRRTAVSWDGHLDAAEQPGHWWRTTLLMTSESCGEHLLCHATEIIFIVQVYTGSQITIYGNGLEIRIRLWPNWA